MSCNGEEWADNAADFFDEFAQNTKVCGAKSLRKRNRELKEGDTTQALIESNKTRATRAEEARRRIAAVVVSRASSKEIEKAVASIKKQGRARGSTYHEKETRQDNYHSKGSSLSRHTTDERKQVSLKAKINSTVGPSKLSEPFSVVKQKQRKSFSRGRK
ncbi:unnamed protein product [Phytomonas sp. Hart1]|nr:unnamed protein product [Phytomonas sp. Hart1]|eukprot:CCW69500.1 unnamed protein product [Phytomonas sp. isolate Hart1]